MNYNFKGIDPKIINLLSENRFNDSKPFYEEHKEELKQNATIPMRQIVLDLASTVLSIDDKMYTEPNYTVSRIRRDTRHTKDKTMYRENLWLMLRRNKKEFPFAPFYYFEFTPYGYSYGLVYWVDRQTKMDYLRHDILNHPKKWKNAVKACESTGAKYEFYNEYKTEKMQNVPETLKQYIQAKDHAFTIYRDNLSDINSPKLIDTLKLFINTTKPMYDFFISSYDRMIAEEIK